MKTFDEAIKLIGCDPRNRKEVEFLFERASRYESLVKEARDNRIVDILIISLIEMAIDERLERGPQTALFTAFTIGLIVGIEMEKNDKEIE